MNHANVIIKPLITEKSLALAAFGKYTFLINNLSCKGDVRVAVKKLFNVTPVEVKIIRYTDHKRRINIMNPKKGSPKRKIKHLKKAIVTVGTDEKIDYFDIEA